MEEKNFDAVTLHFHVIEHTDDEGERENEA